MYRFFNRAVPALATVMVLGALATVAQAKTIRGAIVHHNVRAHSFVVADRSGHLFAIHAARAPRIGSKVVVTAKLLRDGTWKLERLRRLSRTAHRVRIRGVVTFIDSRSGAFTVSARGVSMIVRRRLHLATDTADAPPAVGTTVVATGSVDDQGDLEAEDVQDVGQATDGVDLEGVVLAIDTTAQTITVSSDDDDQSGGSVVVTVPPTLDITQFTMGEEVELKVQPTGAGTATLLGSADDTNAQSANDQSDSQGDNPGGDQGDNGGSSGSSDSPGDGSSSSPDSSGTSSGSSTTDA
jgi:uncharacterized membrane protein YgcG